MRILLEAYGCTLNKGEALELRDMLESHGAEVVAGDADVRNDASRALPGSADGHPSGRTAPGATAAHRAPSDSSGFDAAVIFTCIVIDATQQQMVRRVKELSASIGRVHVLGCLPATLPHLLEGVKGVTLWDIDERVEAASAIANGSGAGNPAQGQEHKVSSAIDDLTVPFPIASGCLGACAYCLTKRARGDLRSRSAEGLAMRFDELYARGFREFRLTSQDAGVWGADTGTDLNSLLDSLLAKEGDFRLRVGMMNPLSLRRIMPGYVDHIRDSRVYKFLHLPVQSGSDRVLGLMNRGYRSDEALEMVEHVRASIPDITVSTDIITGFPTETEDELRMTLDLVRKMKPSIVNVTRFSARPGTPAMKMSGHLFGCESKEFSRIASEETRAMIQETLRGHVGKTMRAFTVAREKDITVARTDNYLVVRLPGKVALGRTVEVKLKELDVVSYHGILT